MILLVDNYDSFTYNLVQLLPENVKILRNDDPELFAIAEKASAIVLSPGPGRPAEAGMIEMLIRRFYRRKPILGICLGHQAIGEVFGGKIVSARRSCMASSRACKDNLKGWSCVITR